MRNRIEIVEEGVFICINLDGLEWYRLEPNTEYSHMEGRVKGFIEFSNYDEIILGEIDSYIVYIDNKKSVTRKGDKISNMLKDIKKVFNN